MASELTHPPAKGSSSEILTVLDDVVPCCLNYLSNTLKCVRGYLYASTNAFGVPLPGRNANNEQLSYNYVDGVAIT